MIKKLTLTLNEYISALEAMITAVRAYFRDVIRVRDYISKVQLYESESDKIAEKIKRIVFRSELKLSEKIHMRYFTLHIESIAPLGLSSAIVCPVFIPVRRNEHRANDV